MTDLFGELSLNPDWTIRYANASAAQMLGADEASLIGKSLVTFVKAERPNPQVFNDASLATVGEHLITRDVLLERPSGQTIWARLRISVNRTSDGVVVPRNAALIDISDLSSESENYVQSVDLAERFHAIGDQVFYTWRLENEKIIYITESVEKICGISRLEAYQNDRWCTDIIHPEDRENAKTYFKKCASLTAPCNIEYRIITKCGNVKWIWHRAEAKQVGNSGNFLYYGVLSDISDIKNKERAISELESFKNISSITADLAHNFNNILSVITLNCGLLLGGGKSDGELIRRVEVIKRVTQRARDITTSLMAISRIQSLQAKTHDLNVLLTEMKDLIGAAVGPAICVTYDLTEICCFVTIDASGLTQAIFNILVNARQAMPAGGAIAISTSVRRRNIPDLIHASTDGGLVDYVELCIADTGPGMTPNVLAHAVEPYFTTKKAEGGSGIGLAATNGFAIQSGGELRLENIAGGGLAVRLFFPLAASANNRSEVSAKTPRIAPLRALIVDDDLDLLENLSDALSLIGFECERASSIEKAISDAERRSYDLLLSDIALSSPRDGLDLLDMFKQRWPQTAVILMSGYVAYTNEVPGDVTFLNKPFEIEALFTAVEQLFPGETGT